MSPKKKVGKKIGRFIMTRLSLFIITFLVVVSAITLAAYTTILNGETKPTTSGTLAVTRGQKVHDFVNLRTMIGLSGLKTPGNLSIGGNTGVVSRASQLYVNGNTEITNNVFLGSRSKDSKLFLYGSLQLSTMSNIAAYTTCNTGAIGTIRMRMPSTAGTETFCPLELCYPGAQAQHTTGISRKSACDPITFTSVYIRGSGGILADENPVY